MKIETYVKKETEVKTINVYVKISDRFSGTIKNSEGEIVCDIEDSYVPSFFPGDHYGDYLILDIDLKTGQILNRKTPSTKELKNFIEEKITKKARLGAIRDGAKMFIKWKEKLFGRGL